MRIRYIAIIVFTMAFLSACGGGGDNNNPNTNPPPNPPPALSGVLLLGADDDNAVAKIVLFSPTPVEQSRIRANGLLSTRLDAVIDPVATVAQVNAALESVGARIDGMVVSNPVVVLSIPEVTDRAAAQVIADTLQASDAFLFVTVTFEAINTSINANQVTNSLNSGSLPLLLAQNTTSPDFDWHQAARFPALTRADPVATAANVPVAVIIPNTYVAPQNIDTSHIPAQVFLDGVLPGSSITYGAFETDNAVGSMGYSIASIIANTSLTISSAYPEPASNLLKITSAPLGGLSAAATVMTIKHSIVNAIVMTGLDKYVLHTDFTYLDDDFGQRDRTWRAIDALNWRHLAADGGHVLHVAAVGALGDSTGAANHANYSSPFAVSEAYSDLTDLILEDPELDFGSAELLDFLTLRTLLNNPSSVGNLLVVGSSRLNSFTRSDFSTPGADVRVVGENVNASCFTSALPCVDNEWKLSNTSVAAAQVAGLAAWMLNMDSTLNAIGVMTVIKHAYQSGQLVGIVDTYAALLSLDTSVTEAPIRKSILDISDTSGTGVRDGIFDEGDIEIWLNTAFPTYLDGLPFDLNGDGHIGGSDTAWFDLDINALPVYTTVMQTIGEEEVSFNEEAVTDFDVLCYYAYSDLYTGNEAQRDELLQEACNQPPFLIIEVDGPEELEADEFETIEIKLLNFGNENLAGLFVKIVNVTGGSVSTQNGVTDSEGVFTTIVNLNEANEGEEGGLQFIIEVSTTENGDPITSIEHSIDLVTLSPDGVYYISQTHLVGATFLNEDPVLLFGSSIFGANNNASATVTVTDRDFSVDNFVLSRLSYAIFGNVNNAIVFGEGLQIQSVADVQLIGVGSINTNYSRVEFEVIGTAMPYSIIFSNNTDVGNMTWEMKLTDQSGNFIVNCPLQGSCGNTTNFSGEISGLLNAGIYIFELDVGLTGQGSARATATLKIGEVGVFEQ